MYTDLLSHMRQLPPLYAPSSHPFWDDEHISARMLEAHLDPNWDAASRNHAFIGASAQFIGGLCGGGQHKALLDLGCGPGLYAEAFAAQGFTVTGVDFSRRSVAYAKAHTAPSSHNQFHCMNYLDIDYDGAFDAVTLIYCDLGVLPPRDRERVLRKALRALKPGGLFFADGWTALDPFQEGDSVSYHDGGFYAAEPYLLIQRSRLYAETANTLDQYLVVTEAEARCYNIWNQIFTKDSFARELLAAGFQEVSFYDDAAGKPYSGAYRSLFAAARK